MNATDTETQTIDQLVATIAEREQRARKRAVLYTLIPIFVAAILVIWTGKYLSQARAEVEGVQEQVDALQRKAESLNAQLQDSATKLVDIAKVATQIESLVESKQSYLRTIDEARFLIDLRMKFDSLNAEILKLSATAPALRSINRDRRWVTVVKSLRELAPLKEAASTWVSAYGKPSVAIYRTPNGFYALCVLGDGSFTQAYRLTVSLMQSGRATDAYFADANSWGANLLEP
jgi:TolA-binding protein